MLRHHTGEIMNVLEALELPARPGGQVPTDVRDRRLTYHYLVAVDIERFSKLNAFEQLVAQADLELALDQAARRTALDRTAWHRQPAGDGELAVLPLDTDGLHLVADYPVELARSLAEINTRRYPAGRLRLRMAIHHGTLAEGFFGAVGEAPILVSRLLDSDELRRELTDHPESDLALAVSSSLYSEVIETRLGGLDPAEFDPISVSAKGRDYLAYVHRAIVARSDDETAGHGLTPIPPSGWTSGNGTIGATSGRHCGQGTRPGSTSRVPSKNRLIWSAFRSR
jgi:hypothetical protein